MTNKSDSSQNGSPKKAATSRQKAELYARTHTASASKRHVRRNMNRTMEGSFLNDTESAKLRLNTSHIRQRRMRNHENSTGPGDYETVTAFQRQSQSKNITGPAFTMRGRTRGAVISKRHVQDWTGVSTPGAGNYEAKSLDAGLRFSVSK